jgi:signal transduction histidine kinase/ligand-binding sensor domain-containing protein/CheY-like chemotaxis protein
MAVKRFKWIFAGIVFLFVQSTILGQEDDVLFSHLTIEDGLSQNTIDDIFQDSRGFIWISTWNGLNKYDGKNFTKYYNAKNSRNGLSSNVTHCIEEDAYGNIWIGTDNGINYFNYKSSKFKHYFVSDSGLSSNNILCLFFDPLGRLWIGHEKTGIDIALVSETGKLTFIKHIDTQTNPVSILSNSITNFYSHDPENIWICTLNGITRISKDLSYSENITPERFPFIPFKSNRIYNLMYYNRFYWIASHEGLIKVDFHNESARTYSYNSQSKDGIPHNHVTDLVLNKDNNIVVATHGGLAIFDLNSNKFKTYKNELYKPRSLTNNFISCLFLDKQKNIWIGTEKGGVNRFNSNLQKFEYLTYNPVDRNSLNANIINCVIDTKNWLLISADGGGLNAFNKQSGSFKHFTIENSSLSCNTITTMFLDSNQTVWIGTYDKGLNYININDLYRGNFKHISKNSSPANSLSSNYISTITSDIYGNIWVGSQDGIDKLLPNKKVINFRQFGINRVSKILFDSKNQLWIASKDGLFIIRGNNFEEISPVYYQKFEYKSDSKNTESIHGQYFISLMKDYANNIWVGSYDNGVNKAFINSETSLPDSFRHYTTANGLSSNTIYSIEEDSNRNIWFGTDYGLSRLIVKQNRFTNYYTNDGLLSNQFNQNSSFKNNEGKLFFGSLNGLIAFNPENIIVSDNDLAVQLTNFEILGQPVYPNEKGSPIPEHINNTHKIVLDYSQNTFSFDFVAINYYNPNLYGYRYFLNGADENWKNVGGDLSASYTKLEPGNYVFCVQAYELINPSHYSEKKITIIIKPPFYRTLGFKLASAIIILLLIVFIVNERIKTYKFRNNLLEKKVRNRTHELEERNHQILEQNIEIKAQSEEILSKNEEIHAQKDLLVTQKSEIEAAYRELSTYKSQLENLVQERTQELMYAKDRAEESDRLKSSFLENLSHEIRTPLNAIVGFTNLAFSEEVNINERDYFRKVVEENSNSLLDLISDILEISNLESNNLQLQKSKCSISQIIQDIRLIFDREFSKLKKASIDNLTLNINIPEEIQDLTFYSDSDRILQILTILINNAIKYTPMGQIDITCAIDDHKLLFSVKDSGIGIHEKHHKTIFERFRKVFDNNEEMYRGAGIGLAIAAKLSELFNGEINVESTLGKGSNFTFSFNYIPFVESDHVKSHYETPNSKVNIPDLEGKTILIAEDESTNYFYMESILIPTKANILHAANGKQAVELVHSQHVDLIFMDIKMPKMNGYDAFNLIKSSFPEIHIIAQTAYFNDNNLIKINDVGFDGFIAKPIAPSTLYKAINEKYLPA